MKKIINGRLYNTDTAKELGDNWNGEGAGDLDYFCETLYRKRTGEFFLHGEGGARTQYSRSVGNNNWSGGEEIIPLSLNAAKKWAEENLDADKYMEIFGPVSEGDNGYKVFSANLTNENYNKLKKMNGETGESMSSILNRLIEKA